MNIVFQTSFSSRQGTLPTIECKMKTTAALASYLLCSVLTASCSLLTTTVNGLESVTIVTPPPHPVYLLAFPGEIPSYTIRWYDREGNVHEYTGVENKISIVLETGLMTPILAIPEEKTGTDKGFLQTDILPVAGALYPLQASLENDRALLETTWQGGIPAICAETICLAAAGGFETGRNLAGHFNWTRFGERLAGFQNPLWLDRERFVEAVLSGKVSMYDIVPVKYFTVRIAIDTAEIPTGTEFFTLWSLQSPHFFWNDDRTAVFEAPEGLSHFVSAMGFITVQIEKGKPVFAFFSPYSLQD